MANPNIRLLWPVDSRRINQRFGENPDFYKPFKLPGHEGLDLFAPTGANIYAAADGEVFQSDSPSNHPYGLHVRIQHEENGVSFRTVYAHLQRSFVKVGQKVKAGDRIGLADNTGNSFGSHLHFTLKVVGHGVPGYPRDIVDPLPYLNAQPSPVTPTEPRDPNQPPPPPSGFTIYTTSNLNLRMQATTSSPSLGLLGAGEPLEVLGDAADAKANLGKHAWIHVRTNRDLNGFVYGLFLDDERLATPSDLVVYPISKTNMRVNPGVSSALLDSYFETDELVVLGDSNVAKANIGLRPKWLHVRGPNGLTGYVAAWLVRQTGEIAPETDLYVSPTFSLNVRARPTTSSNVMTVAMTTDVMDVLGDDDEARTRVGKSGQWLNVRTSKGFVGWVAAEFVRQVDAPAAPPPKDLTPRDAPPPPPPAETDPEPVPTPPVTDPEPPKTMPPVEIPPPETPPQITDLFVYPTTNVNVRKDPSISAARIGGALFNEELRVVEKDLAGARAKVGNANSWVNVELANGTKGWIFATLLSLSRM